MRVYVMGYIDLDAEEDDDIREEVKDFFGKAKVDFDLDEVEVCDEIDFGDENEDEEEDEI